MSLVSLTAKNNGNDGCRYYSFFNLLLAWHCATRSYFTLESTVISILQVKELRFREVKSLIRDHATH